MLLFNSIILVLGRMIVKLFDIFCLKDSHSIIHWSVLCICSFTCSILFLNDEYLIQWDELFSFDHLCYVLFIFIFLLFIEVISPSYKFRKNRQREVNEETIKYRECSYDNIQRKIVDVLILFAFILSLLEMISDYYAHSFAYGLILILLSAMSIRQMVYHSIQLKNIPLNKMKQLLDSENQRL